MPEPDRSYWEDRDVLVTGGASFIGSHLVDELVRLGASVTVIDDLSSGKKENLCLSIDKIRLVRFDLEYCNLGDLISLFAHKSIVFHLAANHGGRGYIDGHPADVCSNFSIDHHVLEASCQAEVENVVFASSACVYPPRLQDRTGLCNLLREEESNLADLEGPLSADVEYGWAKLMGEMQLRAFVKQYGLKGCSLRFVTAYGPRENETHCIISLISKALERMEPYVIWGSGDQERDFTYVSDIVSGTLSAAAKIHDGSAINLGTGKRYAINEVAEKIFSLAHWHPRSVVFDPTMPTGVLSRALDIQRAREILGWEPRATLEYGLKQTIQWYRETHACRGQVDNLILTERA